MRVGLQCRVNLEVLISTIPRVQAGPGDSATTGDIFAAIAETEWKILAIRILSFDEGADPELVASI